MDERTLKIGANILHRVIRTSGMSVMELSRQGKVAYDSLLAAVNGQRLMPVKDAIRICMLSGVQPEDIA